MGGDAQTPAQPSKARRVVGIDLGTSNTVVAWAPRHGRTPPQVLALPQLVGPTEIEARPLYPSMLYAPVAGEAPVDPWGDAPWVSGELARRRGSEVPGRLVGSSKSWLSHAAVDRTAAILPWGLAEDSDVPRLSPVDAAARLLAHVRAAWDAEHGDASLAEQEVVLTVPASFDEVARELTVRAAETAGLSVRLLEEPQAAFYDFMRSAGPERVERLLDAGEGECLVLICDVGGGTTDLSLIRVSRAPAGAEDAIVVERVAVGHHLLLGGDNMDLALAHVCEAKLVAPPARLDAARFAQLVAACRAAKERLLGNDPPDGVPIAVAGSGSKLVGGTLSTRLEREEVERVVLEGFFPAAPRDARPQRAKGGLLAFGLPYERDVAITRHVAWFFARHAPGAVGPRALLLNGGVFNAPRLARRLAEAIEQWGGPPLEVLPHGDADLAVARGAVAYGLALLGRGRRIEGGSARGYYLGVQGRDEARTAVCVVPRGSKEGVRHVVGERPFDLVVGRPVRFDLYASDDDRIDAPGALVSVDDDGFLALPPLSVSFEAGARRRAPAAGAPGSLRPPGPPPSRGATVRVALEGELTAVGTVDLACAEVSGERRFRLAFQLRGAEEQARAPSQAPPSRAAPRLEEALAAVRKVFGTTAQAEARDAKQLQRELERLLGERGAWTTETARALYDALLEDKKTRKRSLDHERVFWALAGFCLRPGFGHPLDAQRVARLVPLFGERLAFPDEVRGWQQFWIAWRRIAAGLEERLQTQLRDLCDPFFAPAEKKLKKPKGLKAESGAEMLEMVSSLERVPAARRSELGAWVLERTWTDRDPRLWSALGRLGARTPAYASLHHVVSPQVAERWLEHVLREKWGEISTAPAAAVQMARLTGDRARDVSAETRREVADKLRAISAKEDWIRVVEEVVPVEEAERAGWFGEALPVGLRLVGG